MHIEPGVVDGAKMALGYATAAGAFAITGKLALDTIRNDGGIAALLLRSGLATVLVFCFFEILPHYPVGPSEVHFIFGATLLLIFGAGPAAIGLASGLLLQGTLFAPSDVPMYFINVTTLLVPLWAVHELAKRIVPAGTPYASLSYGQVMALSLVFQAGVVGWVAFWVLYGQGFGAEATSGLLSFGAAYILIVAVEPIVSLGALAAAKLVTPGAGRTAFTGRIHRA